MFSLERRVEQSKLWLALSPLLAIVLTILSGIIIFSVLDKDPWLSLYTFFKGDGLSNKSKSFSYAILCFFRTNFG